MKVKCLQFDMYLGDGDKNIQKVENKFAESDLSDVDTVVLPEMGTTGYDLERIDEIASNELEPVKSKIQILAKRYTVNIVAGSIANKKNNEVKNTAFVVNKEGEFIYEYSKMHLVPMLNEPKFLVGGNSKANVFELDGEKARVLICYDLRFPEVFRDLALEGAKIIFVVDEWPIERM